MTHKKPPNPRQYSTDLWQYFCYYPQSFGDTPPIIKGPGNTFKLRINIPRAQYNDPLLQQLHAHIQQNYSQNGYWLIQAFKAMSPSELPGCKGPYIDHGQITLYFHHKTKAHQMQQMAAALQGFLDSKNIQAQTPMVFDFSVRDHGNISMRLAHLNSRYIDAQKLIDKPRLGEAFLNLQQDTAEYSQLTTGASAYHKNKQSRQLHLLMRQGYRYVYAGKVDKGHTLQQLVLHCRNHSTEDLPNIRTIVSLPHRNCDFEEQALFNSLYRQLCNNDPIKVRILKTARRLYNYYTKRSEDKREYSGIFHRAPERNRFNKLAAVDYLFSILQTSFEHGYVEAFTIPTVLKKACTTDTLSSITDSIMSMISSRHNSHQLSY